MKIHSLVNIDLSSQVLRISYNHLKKIPLGLKNLITIIFLSKLFKQSNSANSIPSTLKKYMDLTHPLIDLKKKLIILKLFILRNSTADEKVVLSSLISKLSVHQLSEFLKGAHVRIEDCGEHYHHWSRLRQTRERISSHPCIKNTKQYGIMGKFSHEILFGIIEKDNKICTFIQLENTPWAPGLHHRIKHSFDALKYVLYRKNIGPYGQSIHTDSNPIYLKCS